MRGQSYLIIKAIRYNMYRTFIVRQAFLAAMRPKGTVGTEAQLVDDGTARSYLIVKL